MYTGNTSLTKMYEIKFMLKWNCRKWTSLIVTYLNKHLKTGYVRFKDHAAFVKYRRLTFVQIIGGADIDVQ